MAARGYWDAFQVWSIALPHFGRENPGTVADETTGMVCALFDLV